MSNIRKWNVCTKKTYQANQGEKAYWPAVGTLTFFPAKGDNKGGFQLELNMMPETKFYVFEQKPKEEQSSSRKEPDVQIASEGSGSPNPDEIPF